MKTDRRFIALLLLLTICLAAPQAAAHAAPPAPKYFTRFLHDCNDDWGTHSAYSDGHDLIALDVTERYVPSLKDDLVVLRAAIDKGYAAQGSAHPVLKLLYTIKTGSTSITSQVETTDNQVFKASTGGSFVAPAMIWAPKPVMKADGTGQDGTRVALEIGFRYSQLGIQPGGDLRFVSIQGFAGSTKTDYMAGGYWTQGSYVSACPVNGTTAEAYFVRSSLTLKGSAQIYFDAVMTPTAITAKPDGNVSVYVNVTNKLQNTPQTVNVSATLPSGWAIHVSPQESMSMAKAGKADFILHYLPGPVAVDGVSVVSVLTTEGGFRQFTVTLTVDRPAPTTDTGTPTTPASGKGDNAIPGPAAPLILAAFLGAFVLRGRRKA
jgi:hypothetical protein